MEINRSAAAVFGVKVDFPRLAQRVGLDEVTLVVHVKSVGHRVVFEIGNKTSDVNGGHHHSG